MTVKKLISVFLASLLVCLTLPFGTVFASGVSELFVAPDGNDSAPGTKDAPLATLNGAKEKAKALNGKVTVYFREGSYTLTDTVNFGEGDKADVTYKAYNGEKVVFTAGVPYTGFEECTVNGVKAFKKNVGKGADFNVLFSEKTMLKRTHYPESGYLYVKSVQRSDVVNPDNPSDLFYGYMGMFAKKGDVPVFKNYEDVVIRILHYWKDEMLTVTGIDTATGHVSFSRPTSMKVAENDRYFFENVFEALNEPGEWYLDKSAGTLYYIPEVGEDASSLTLWGSVTETMIKVSGVNGVSFENIVFRGNGFNIPHNNTGCDDSSQAGYDATPCVYYENAHDFRITNCEFRDLAACAVFMGTAVTDAAVENCVFENLGAQAVYIRGTNVQVDDPRVTKNITVYNNVINGYGRVFFNSVGVLIIHANSVNVCHNEIHDGYYTAVSVGWVWGYGYTVTYNCKICDNLIYNIGQGWLSDMGGIYTLGVQPGTVLFGNVIHNVAADPGQGGYGGWGIYPDEGSSKMLIEKNLVYACGNDSYHLHYGADNTVRNNIFALSAESQVRVCSKYEEHKTADFTNNIILTDGSTPVFSHMDDPIAFTAEKNIIWNLSDKTKILFLKDSDLKKGMSLATAKRKGFIGDNSVIDPLFLDARNFDFTLAKNSPVYSLGFEAWDYSNAGTVKGSTVGLGTPGGITAYNASAVPQELKSAKEYLPFLSGIANKIVRLFNMLLGIFGAQVKC